jgi:putative PEP-CTERM system TPR-repeat lipoprotein
VKRNKIMLSIIYKWTITILIIFEVILLIGGVTACSKAQTSQALVAEAKQYQLKGDNKAAIIQLKNAIQKNPDDSESRYLLGTIYYNTGDPKSAEKELRKALSLGMSPDKVLPILGKCLIAMGEFQKVLDETKQVSGGKESAEMSSLRGNAFQALGKSTEAKTSFEIALKYDANFPDALIGLARHSLLEKDIESATGYSDRAVSQNPQNPDVWLFKGDLLRAQGKTGPALAAYDQSLKIQPNNIQAHLSRAFLEIASEQFDAAKLDIDAAHKDTPNDLRIKYTQALLDFRQGKSAAALEALQQVLRAAPENMPSILLAGAVQYTLGSMPQAEQYLKKYLNTNPDNLYARKLLAATLLKSHQTQEAINVLSPALKDTQQDVQLFTLAGQLSMQAGDFAKATEYFAKASALSPKEAGLHSALGLSKLALGENDRAVAEMETAVGLDTKSPKSSVLLVLTHLRLKEYDEALAAAIVIEKEQPDDPLAYNLKGAAYLGKNDIAAARASFEKAASIQPINFPALVNLVRLDLQEKNPDAAKKRLEAFLDKDKKNIQVMTMLAGLDQSRGQNKEATDFLERASKENPDMLEPALLLAFHYLHIGEKQKALTLAQKLQGSNPENLQTLDILAKTQMANGDHTAALKTYYQIAAIKPDSAAIQYNIASIHMAMENPSAASDALKKALSLEPNYLDAQLAMATLKLRNEDYDGALSIARQIQKNNGKSPLGYVMEGDVLLVQKKPALAAKAYEQALAIGKSGQLMVKLHASLSQAGKSKEANSRLTQWIKEHPTDIPPHIYLAQRYLSEKQYKAAIEQFQAILQQDPKNIIALNDLAWTYHQEKDPHALEYAEKANQLEPANPAVLDTLGWILIEQGDTTRGLPLLQKANSLAPKAAEIHYHFVLGLVKSGDKIKARKELEQLLASGKPFSGIDEAKTLLKQL